mmetsp:Transcript_18709/g.51368  ORF Transcript_18709/g.51368 Transcript_18709/m.51368 type:complete len:188 (-) Transcript_18709:167-730(-)
MGVSQAQMLKALIPAMMVIALQKFDIEKAGLVNHCRAVFFVAQAIALGISFTLRHRIACAKETGEKVHIPAMKSFGQEVRPAAVMSVPEYDFSKWQEQLQQVLIGAMVCYGIHCQWGFVTPIVMQIFMTPVNVLDHPLAKVYIFGKVAKGELLRPWAQPNPLGLQGTAQTAKERKQEAKKAGKGKKQ